MRVKERHSNSLLGIKGPITIDLLEKKVLL